MKKEINFNMNNFQTEKNNLKNGEIPTAKKFLFVSLESLSGDLAWQIKKEGNEVKVFILNPDDQDVYDGFLEKVDDWKKYIDWADVICYDKKTEVLTKNGWKFFKEIKTKDQLATLNPVNFALEYYSPTKIINYKYKGAMIYYNSLENEFCVTPNHKMFVKDYKGRYVFEKAENIFQNTRKHIKLNCNWRGKFIDKIKIPDHIVRWEAGKPRIDRSYFYNGFTIKLPHLLAIAGFYISEGAIIKRWNNLNGIRIYQNYGLILKEFKKILKKANISFCLTKKEKGEEIRIHNGALAKFLVDNFGEGAFKKHISTWIKELDSNNLEILLEWLMYGDGHKGKHHWYYSSVSKQLLDDVQEILLKVGSAGRVKNNVVSIIKFFEPRLKNKKYWAKINYNDHVYCVEVQNHIIYVRRNGKPMWCGNCFDDIGFGDTADLLRKSGKLVVGGSKYTDQLEEDREFGQNEMKKVNMLVLPHWDFSDFDSAINFIKQNSGRYVFKPSGNTSSDQKGILFLGQEDDGRDLIEILEQNKKTWAKKIKKIQLQKMAVGVEVAVGTFFNGKDFIYPVNINFEHKKLFPGDIGPYTGEMGTLAFWCPPNQIFESTLLKMKDDLAKSGYVGYIDINCIANAKGIYPLEFTSRFGYPTISVHMEGATQLWGEFLFRIARGESVEIKTKKGFQMGVIVAVPPFPYDDKKESFIYKDMSIIFKKPNLEGVHLGDVKVINDVWVIAGNSGYALVITGSGTTVEEARKQVYSRLKNILIQNMYYRTDIGLKWFSDSDKLQTWGYLYGSEKNAMMKNSAKINVPYGEAEKDAK